jgi:predicted transcriptional regulator
MQLTQIQYELIEAARTEGQVHPDAFAHRLSHNCEDVHAAISDLVEAGLLAAAEGDAYRLTNQGEAVNRARDEANRAAVVRRTRSWQPR